MRKTVKVVGMLVSVLALAFSMVGCGGSTGCAGTETCGATNSCSTGTKKYKICTITNVGGCAQTTFKSDTDAVLSTCTYGVGGDAVAYSKCVSDGPTNACK